MKKAIFVLSGNCRTFNDCIYSIYTHIITRLFTKDVTISVYLYLKLSDPGPKGQTDWNFEYKDVDIKDILDKISLFKMIYPDVNVEYKLMQNNEISDEELMSQVKDRNLYNGVYAKDNIFLRGLHCHYNLEKCGIYILDKEDSMQCKFDYVIYLRPDLCFIKDCDTIETYNTSIVTLGIGPNEYNNDHVAIIPRIHLNAFFFDRINLYRNNTTHIFLTPEEVYWNTIPYEVKSIGDYYIKRPLSSVSENSTHTPAL
jgi:hypothetical protein